MRLLNTDTITLEEFFEGDIPRYAILSHTWRDEEVSFQDMQPTASRECVIKKAGNKKIAKACEQASKDGLAYAWVDTCCIDKSSSAELSEAINSMFNWYQKATVCYVYMDDVPSGTDPRDASSAFAKSRWFTRGWTLQELLAPFVVLFFDQDWSVISSKRYLASHLSAITKIDETFLGSYTDKSGWRGDSSHYHREEENLEGCDLELGPDPVQSQFFFRIRPLEEASVAARMSWAAGRKTTRTEDIAYSLLGLFNINMHLLYGEGGKAFIRLQEAIMSNSDDESLFAWETDNVTQDESAKKQILSLDPQSKTLIDPTAPSYYFYTSIGALALSPASFASCGDIVPCDCGESGTPFSITNKGLRITVPMTEHSHPYILLRCRPKFEPTAVVAIQLFSWGNNYYYSRHYTRAKLVSYEAWHQLPKRQLYVKPSEANKGSPGSIIVSNILIQNLPSGFYIKQVDPKETWPRDQRLIPRYPGAQRAGTLVLLQSDNDDNLRFAFYFWDRKFTHQFSWIEWPLYTFRPITLDQKFQEVWDDFKARLEANDLAFFANPATVDHQLLCAEVRYGNILGTRTAFVDIRMTSNVQMRIWTKMKYRFRVYAYSLFCALDGLSSDTFLALEWCLFFSVSLFFTKFVCFKFVFPRMYHSVFLQEAIVSLAQIIMKNGGRLIFFLVTMIYTCHLFSYYSLSEPLKVVLAILYMIGIWLVFVSRLES
jgi:hypothetical protein